MRKPEYLESPATVLLKTIAITREGILLAFMPGILSSVAVFLIAGLPALLSGVVPDSRFWLFIFIFPFCLPFAQLLISCITYVVIQAKRAVKAFH